MRATTGSCWPRIIVTRRLFVGMLGNIAALSVPAGKTLLTLIFRSGRAIGGWMERYLRKSAGDGLGPGFGLAAMIEPALQ